MPYLIDGHNLIPKLGLRLDSFDDEMALLDKLNEFCRLTRKTQLEVYFDNAQPGYAETRRIGLVTAHFVRKPLIADEAIRLRLKKLGKAAKNWMVVSSDHSVQNSARAAGARPLSSEEFAGNVIAALRSGSGSNSPPSEATAGMSEGELDEWVKLFRAGRGDLSKF
jgi:predicted RNA-binding protein with PIN domain